MIVFFSSAVIVCSSASYCVTKNAITIILKVTFNRLV